MFSSAAEKKKSWGGIGPGVGGGASDDSKSLKLVILNQVLTQIGVIKIIKELKKFNATGFDCDRDLREPPVLTIHIFLYILHVSDGCNLHFKVDYPLCPKMPFLKFWILLVIVCNPGIFDEMLNRRVDASI